MKKTVMICLLAALVFASGVVPQGVFAAESTEVAAVHVVNINQAGAVELQGLPGIGPALAERIIAHREANGPFESVDQLTAVKGVGERKLEKIRGQLVLE